MENFLNGFIKKANLANLIRSKSLRQLSGAGPKVGISRSAVQKAYNLPTAKAPVGMPSAPTIGQRPVVKTGAFRQGLRPMLGMKLPTLMKPKPLNGLLKASSLKDRIASISLKQLSGPGSKVGVSKKSIEKAFASPKIDQPLRLPPKEPASSAISEARTKHIQSQITHPYIWRKALREPVK